MKVFNLQENLKECADCAKATQLSVHNVLDPALQESQFCENGGGRSEKLVVLPPCAGEAPRFNSASGQME